MTDSAAYTADFVSPCYNEEEALPQTAPAILAYARSLRDGGSVGLAAFRLLLIDDGSSDRTWAIISQLARDNPEVVGVKLSRNYGHQRALLAGLAKVDADACVSLDADLQDDITVIEAMFRAFEGGADLALGVRNDRSSDTAFKRITAAIYYRVVSWFGVTVVADHADFRLMSRRALSALLAHEEVNLYLRGLIPSLGFNTALIPYTRQARVAGETKYTLHKMLRLAFDGITSFSAVPLRAVGMLGAAISVISAILAAVIIVITLTSPQSVIPGWASTVLPLIILGGLQILSIGVVGEYVAKIYMEVKRRPRFIVETATDDETLRSRPDG